MLRKIVFFQTKTSFVLKWTMRIYICIASWVFNSIKFMHRFVYFIFAPYYSPSFGIILLGGNSRYLFILWTNGSIEWLIIQLADWLIALLVHLLIKQSRPIVGLNKILAVVPLSENRTKLNISHAFISQSLKSQLIYI